MLRQGLGVHQRGVTLIELMVAMVLGLLLTAGVIQVFIGNRATYAFNESLSWIQENARFAVDQIANNARMAGYAGCLSDVAVINNLNSPNPFRDDLENGLQGFEFLGTGTGQLFAAGAVDPMPLGNANAWSPALPPELVNPTARVIPGSDVLVVRYVNGDSNSLVTPFSDSAQVFVGGPSDFQEGEIVVVTDCQKASIFQITQVQLVGGGPDVNLAHSNASYTPGNSAPSAWGPQQSYGLGSEIARLQTVAFYVGRGESGQPSLFQLRLQRIDATTSRVEPEELVEGIDTMQVRYGVDTDADRQVDAWRTADAVAAANDWGNVLSVEITLLARGAEEYGTETDTAIYNAGGMRFDPVDDRRLRQVFTTTVGVRNRLP
ncbi:MAG TPA: PilW family protein [Gammaproteobacteria bacterium]